MKLTQIRNATIRMIYAGNVFLIDPWLAPKHQLSFVDIPGRPFHVPDPVKENIPMPFYGLPMDTEQILSGVDYYIVTHLHPDYIDIAKDGTVGGPLNKQTPVICQSTEDAKILQYSGFSEVIVLPETGMDFGAAKLTRVPARHGTVVPCGDAMGIIFQSAGERAFYLAGDTIWYSGVEENLRRYQPEVIALNCCAAETVENGRLIMGDEDVQCVAMAAPQAKLYLTHLDNVSHASLTRHTLRGRLAERGVMNYDMPADGQSIEY